MIRAYVLDDERLAVERLTRLLAATRRVEIAGSGTDPLAAIATLRRDPVDVLFLDIEMPELSGFDVVERLEPPPAVVFTTAYDRYAVSAFETNAADYLLKPIDPERLARTIDKLERFRSEPRPDIRALARELASHLTGSRRLERIATRAGERTTLLDVPRVSHFVARDKLTFAVVNGGEHAVDYSLNELEARLDPRRFVRIHRSTIVNVAYVHELYPAVDGGVQVRLKDDARSELGVARDRVRELKQRLGI